MWKISTAGVDDQGLIRDLNVIVAAPLRMDLNDVRRIGIEFHILRDLDSELRRHLELGRSDLVIVENADDPAAPLDRRLRGTRGRALTRRAADIDAAVGRA